MIILAISFTRFFIINFFICSSENLCNFFKYLVRCSSGAFIETRWNAAYLSLKNLASYGLRIASMTIYALLFFTFLIILITRLIVSGK